MVDFFLSRLLTDGKAGKNIIFFLKLEYYPQTCEYFFFLEAFCTFSFSFFLFLTFFSLKWKYIEIETFFGEGVIGGQKQSPLPTIFSFFSFFFLMYAHERHSSCNVFPLFFFQTYPNKTYF